MWTVWCSHYLVANSNYTWEIKLVCIACSCTKHNYEAERNSLIFIVLVAPKNLVHSKLLLEIRPIHLEFDQAQQHKLF